MRQYMVSSGTQRAMGKSAVLVSAAVLSTCVVMAGHSAMHACDCGSAAIQT